MDAYIIDNDAEDEREEKDALTDVEPEDSPAEIAAQEQRKAEQPQVSEALVPEIVAEFRDTVVISDEAELTADITPPTTDAAPLPSTSTGPG